MLKKPKTLLAATLMLVLCFSSISAFASELGDHGPVITETPGESVQAAITKILRLPTGTIPPDATFSFEVTKVSVDGDETDEALDTMPDLNASNLTLSFAPADTPTDTSLTNIQQIVKETGDIFAGVTFPHAGIYVYEIRETANTNEDIDENDPYEVLTYSTAVYTLHVFVARNADDTGTYIHAIGTVITTPDNAGQAAGNKVDATPGGDKTNYFHSQMIFTNDYIKTNGPVDPERPDPIDHSTLSVSKTVAGDFGSTTQYFDFSITLDAPSILPAIPEYYRAFIVEKGEVIDPEDNVTGTSIINTQGNYIMVSTNGATAFKLKHGQQLVFVDTPVGTGYEVTESGAANYIPSVTVITNGGAGIESSAAMGQSLSTDDQLVGELANSAAFTNTRDSVTPTGLNLNDLPFIGLIALGIGSLVLFIVVKSRRRKTHATA